MARVFKELDFSIADETPIRMILGAERWVFVGPYIATGINVVMPFGYCVRYWGTSEGLGQIQEHGPVTNVTKLDPFFRNRYGLVVNELENRDVNEEIWLRFLSDAEMRRRLRILGQKQ